MMTCLAFLFLQSFSPVGKPTWGLCLAVGNMQNSFSIRALAIACGITIGAASNAVAADLAPEASGPGWIVTVGAMVTYEPDYRGSDELGFGALPSISWRREGTPDVFSAPDDGFDFALFERAGFKLGPVGTLSAGRSEKDDARLTGLDNYSTSIEAGIFADYWVVPELLRTRAELRHGFRDDDGFILDLGADVVRHVGRVTLAAGPRIRFADSDAMNLRFGVSDQASRNNGHVEAFSADGGLESVGVTASLSYDITQDLKFTVYDRYDHLVGDASDSPITREFGSEDQNTVGMGLTYSFHTAGR
jgi:MipA family protein